MSLFENLKSKITQSSKTLRSAVNTILAKQSSNDKETLQSIKTILLKADVGITTTDYIIQQLKKRPASADINSSLRNIIHEIISKVEGQFHLNCATSVILVCGVNGSGKTSTIGKLAYSLSQTSSVMVATCDTFRAAACDQLEKLVQLTNANFFTPTAQTPSSIAYEAVQQAVKDNYKILLLDTSGRLSGNKNLWLELKKMKTSIQKAYSEAPEKILLVIDSTCGQNVHNQIDYFSEAFDSISGIVFTKVDNDIKPGTILSVAHKHKIPILFLSTGEDVVNLVQVQTEELVTTMLDIKFD
ncbi:signal recognition particle receptor subunit alpha [Candidatus Sneabacter namystus]|uniref:SRP54-type proteins GTP-binding domain-containing protein n=1 Tax=Candidatus Sneabacter namystus TaxID=2601646 RepID=A0A5C0UK42_9RICK|nr:signal recognition particle receptor subunit alpha [Candidatus Sneabacter namystus]QEK39802.1 hypothetical protein FZC37_02605 [Candidatus Sneabacter namystus]